MTTTSMHTHGGRRVIEPCSHETCDELVHLIRRQSAQIGELADALARERTAFLATRPSHVENMLDRLEAAAEVARDLEETRVGLVATIRGIDRHDAARTRGRTLARHLPVDRRATFDESLDELRRATTRLQVELRLGSRLLQYASTIQEGVFRALLGAERETADDAPPNTTYDRTARQAVARTSKEAGAAGRLVDGTV